MKARGEIEYAEFDEDSVFSEFSGRKSESPPRTMKANSSTLTDPDSVETEPESISHRSVDSLVAVGGEELVRSVLEFKRSTLGHDRRQKQGNTEDAVSCLRADVLFRGNPSSDTGSVDLILKPLDVSQQSHPPENSLSAILDRSLSSTNKPRKSSAVKGAFAARAQRSFANMSCPHC